MNLLVLVPVHVFVGWCCCCCYPKPANVATQEKYVCTFQWFSNNDWFSAHSIRWNLQIYSEKKKKSFFFIVHLVTKFALISCFCKFWTLKSEPSIQNKIQMHVNIVMIAVKHLVCMSMKMGFQCVPNYGNAAFD